MQVQNFNNIFLYNIWWCVRTFHTRFEYNNFYALVLVFLKICYESFRMHNFYFFILFFSHSFFLRTIRNNDYYKHMYHILSLSHFSVYARATYYINHNNTILNHIYLVSLSLLLFSFIINIGCVNDYLFWLKFFHHNFFLCIYTY